MYEFTLKRGRQKKVAGWFREMANAKFDRRVLPIQAGWSLPLDGLGRRAEEDSASIKAGPGAGNLLLRMTAFGEAPENGCS